MRVTRLDIGGIRNLAPTRLAPGPGLNVFFGDNGAGKTSVLEALHLMAYGRSFRGRVGDGLIRSGVDALEVFVEWDEADPPRLRRAGLRHDGQTWQGRLDGAPVGQLGELCAALAVVTFEPGSHALVTGGGEARRRFMDWGLFHVEPMFMPHWRRYARALRQRNTLLKARAGNEELDAWDHELAEAGEAITGWRQDYLERLQPTLGLVGDALVPSLGPATLEFQPGWRRETLGLADALLLVRDRDRLTGFTSVGPHRANWRLRHADLPVGADLSRGQAKLAALTCLLAQAEHHAMDRQEWPVVALDDLGSELDRHHQRKVLERLAASQVQVFVTGTEVPAMIQELGIATRLFHVERGVVQPAASIGEAGSA